MPKLNWKLLTKKRGSSTQGLPPGKEDLAWVTNTVTLIYGERDAILVQRAEPLAPGLFIALREVGMRVVIDAIPRYHQANGRNVGDTLYLEGEELKSAPQSVAGRTARRERGRVQMGWLG